MNKIHPNISTLVVYDDGRVYSNITNKFLKQSKNDNGYLLCWADGRLQRVHRLVAETFLTDDQCYGMDVNHKDGDKQNNCVTNLEWCTRSQNIRHAHDTGLNNCHGEDHHSAVYSEDFVHKICKLMQDGWRNKDIALEYGVCKDWLSNIRRGVLWKRVSTQYNIKKTVRKKRISRSKVRYICELLEQGLNEATLSRPPYSFPRSTVGRIKRRELHVDISKCYKF